MPTNTAAWINAKHAKLEVGPAPYTRPGDDQIVIRNHAVAIKCSTGSSRSRAASPTAG